MLSIFRHSNTPYYLICVLLIHLSYIPVIAQNIPAASDLLGISASTTTPALGDTVTIKVTSGQVSKSAVDSTKWFINGKIDEKFNDLLQIDFKVLDLSRPTTITCNITFYYGGLRQQLTQEIIIYPVRLDIIWEGEVVTPAHYLGYPLPGRDAPIRVSADLLYQSGTSVFTERDFSFVWEVNGRVFQGAQGVGKSVIIIPSEPRYDLPKIKVTVTAKKLNNQSFVVKRSVTIPRNFPKLLVYEFEALRGVLHNRAFGKNVLFSEPITLSVYPYFFSLEAFNNGTITYNWFKNGEEKLEEDSRRVNLLLSGDEGAFFLKVVAEQRKGDVLKQKAEYDFTIEL